MASFASSTGSYTPASTIAASLGQDSVGFSVRATVLYIGLSVGILLVVLFMLGFSLIYCVRPNRRRQQAMLAMQRQRAAAIQATKVEDEPFKPQIRPLPVVVLQPGQGEVWLAQRDSCEAKLAEADSTARSATSAEEAALTAVMPAAADPEDPEVGLASTRQPGARAEGSCSSRSSDTTGSRSEPQDCSTNEELLHFNPLTHYLTEKEARYCVVSVEL